MSSMMIDSGWFARRARDISRSAISWNVRRVNAPVSGSVVASRGASAAGGGGGGELRRLGVGASGVQQQEREGGADQRGARGELGGGGEARGLEERAHRV